MEPVRIRALQPGDAGWVIMRHAELYAAEEGFDASFEPLVARILADLMATGDPACDRGWIAAAADGTRLGSIFCARLDDRTARLRLFLVEPVARRSGVGQRLLDTCLDHARACGFARITLWTHAEHRAACRLYQRNGFVCESAQPVQSFGCRLTEQTWSRPLR